MKTIQDCLKECDREEIILSYIDKYTFNSTLMDEKYRDKTIEEIIERQKELLNGMIDRLIQIKPSPAREGERWFLMTIHCSENDIGEEITHTLVSEKEVMDPSLEWVPAYGYEFSPHNEIVNFLVADNYLTQYSLPKLLVDFLYEASFTGYGQEGLEEFLEDLNQAAEEIKSGEAKTITFEDMMKDLEEDGFLFEKKDPAQESAWKKYMHSCVEYNKTCMDIELNKLREQIRQAQSAGK